MYSKEDKKPFLILPRSSTDIWFFKSMAWNMLAAARTLGRVSLGDPDETLSIEDAAASNLLASISAVSTKFSEDGEMAADVEKLFIRFRGVVACINSASPELDMSDALQV